MMAAVMTAITLGELLGAGAGAYGNTEIVDLTLDSHAVQPGAAFVAVAGSRTHGLVYADDALARGAAIVLYDPDQGGVPGRERMLAVPALKDRIGDLARQFFWRERQPPQLLGVTGTNGKTTVAWLVAQSMTTLGRDCAYVGTLGYGRPDALLEHALTTPDCFTLHRELAMLGADYAALEVSSHGLVQNRVAGLRFKTAGVTNLSRDHLDAHGSMEAYAEAKRRIVDLPGLDSLVLNIDDDFAASLVTRAPATVRAIRVSRHARADADILATVTELGLDGLNLDVTVGDASARLRSSLIGDFNAENLLLALGLQLASAVELTEACGALAACRAAPGRLEVFRRHDGMYAVVDYAHTPAALARTLAVLQRLGGASITCVFGCGGDRDRGKRPMMGRAVAGATRVVLTDDNPRSEDPAAIVAQIRKGMRADQPVTVEHDRGHAIAAAIRGAGPGDIVLVAGKGHETMQAVGGDFRPLDDRALVHAAIGAAS